MVVESLKHKKVSFTTRPRRVAAHNPAHLLGLKEGLAAAGVGIGAGIRDGLASMGSSVGNNNSGLSDIGAGIRDLGSSLDSGLGKVGRGLSKIGRGLDEVGKGAGEIGKGAGEIGKGVGEIGKNAGEFGKGLNLRHVAYATCLGFLGSVWIDHYWRARFPPPTDPPRLGLEGTKKK